MVLLGPAKIAFPTSRPTFAASHVERGDELDVTDVVAAQHHVHQPRDGLVGHGVAVVLDALNEAAGAVAHTGDGDTNRTTHDAVAPSCDGRVERHAARRR